MLYTPCRDRITAPYCMLYTPCRDGITAPPTYKLCGDIFTDYVKIKVGRLTLMFAFYYD